MTTPAELRELAGRAVALAAAIDEAKNRLTEAPDEPTQRAGFRLDDTAGEARRVGDDLAATAEDLARIRGRSACRADWGACPDHGATLRASGGQSWCAAAGCNRRWDYDRLSLPCTEPAEFEVTDADGALWFPMCTGHAKHARTAIIGSVISPLN